MRHSHRDDSVIHPEVPFPKFFPKGLSPKIFSGKKIRREPHHAIPAGPAFTFFAFARPYLSSFTLYGIARPYCFDQPLASKSSSIAFLQAVPALPRFLTLPMASLRHS